MFSKSDRKLFTAAGVLLATGFTCMAIDPIPNGFGILTLWLAPPLLLTGFFLPVIGIIGRNCVKYSCISSFKRQPQKHAVGLLTFAIAIVTYLLTLEPTASLWDCSEFISSAYKLQVPHTPGTPLLLLIGRVFTMFSFGNNLNVAWTINLMSGLFSALTVWLLYWVIIDLAERMITSNDSISRTAIMLSSFGGAMTLAFSDTFWFSAVEAETYGPASFFLLLLVWLTFTGKDLTPNAKDRRLILISYLAGLSYCIHPMCLLALPVLPFVWYAMEKRLTYKSVMISIAAGLGMVLFINRFIAIGVFELAYSFDLFFVNQFHFPFYSGAIVLSVVMVLIFYFVLKRYRPYAHISWSVIFLLFGFLPYLMLFIRSNHNPPIDQTNPENLAMIKAYMNRESYPASPLLYGPYFDATIQGIDIKKHIYFQSQNVYEKAGSMPAYVYDSRQTILPRLYSNDADDITSYRNWTGLKPNEKPDFRDNLRFMFTYQLGHMYLRYLMWNFAGRESDVSNSPFLKPWDSGSRSVFQKARNQYWMIPLMLGIIGGVFQFRTDKKGFITVAILFLITGFVLALYLNSPPNEPRERDYIYVASYIAFCMWVGTGLVSLTGLFKNRVGLVLTFCMSVGVPLWMFLQNYDDHDRSGRTFQIDNARNILTSCAPNSILFTGGDNDTFPLWYLQEVEGFRTDVRVMVLSYMNTDWYINQLRKAYYDSPSFELTLGEKDYRQYGANDVLYVQETLKSPIDFTQFLLLLKDEHPALRLYSGNREPCHILPSRYLKIKMPQDVHTVRTATDERKSEDMTLFVSENYLPKNVLAILDLVVSNEWKRPVYFNFTSMNTLGIDISPYLVQEGQVFRLTPARSVTETFVIDPDLMYKNLLEEADYSNLMNANVYFSYEDHFARMIVPIRQSLNSLAASYLHQGDSVMAAKVLDAAIEKLYPAHLPPSYTNLQAAEIFVALGNPDKARSIGASAFEYYFGLVEEAVEDNSKPDQVDVYILRQCAGILSKVGREEYVTKVHSLGLTFED